MVDTSVDFAGDFGRPQGHNSLRKAILDTIAAISIQLGTLSTFVNCGLWQIVGKPAKRQAEQINHISPLLHMVKVLAPLCSPQNPFFVPKHVRQYLNTRTTI